MSSSLRRGTLAATTLALSVATLTACGAGNSAQTLEIKPDNAATQVGVIKLQNVNIVTATDDSGAASVTARIFNDGKKDQTLKAITLGGSGERAELTPAKGEKAVTVPAGGSLALGGKNHAAALFADAKGAGVKNGNAQPVTFDLSSTGAVKLDATVVAAKHGYEKTGPTAKPSEGPGAGASDAPGEKGRKGQNGERDQQEQGGQDGADENSPGSQQTQGAGQQDGAQGTQQDSQQGENTGQ